MLPNQPIPTSDPQVPKDSPLLSVKEMVITFGEGSRRLDVVKRLSFDVDCGECLCIVGESGSGKSVSSLAIMRLLDFTGGRLSGGRIQFHLKAGGIVDLSTSKERLLRQIRGREIGMIFQEPLSALNPVMRIGDQLEEVLAVHTGLSGSEAKREALQLLQRVRINEAARRMAQYPHELSGGMRQRVVIAMAIACKPRLLICDEPTTALDVTTQAEILALIEELKRDLHMAVIFITHDMSVVAQIADRVLVMYKGEKVEEGGVDEIFEMPKADYTRALLQSVPRLGEMTGQHAPGRLAMVSPPQTSALQRDMTSDPSDRHTASLLEVRHLTTRFAIKSGLFRKTAGYVQAVDDVSFRVGHGETVSLVGESGCGKSTCARSIMRMIQPDSGQIWLGGKDILATPATALKPFRRDMQMIFQDPFSSLNPKMRILDQVAEPLRNFPASQSDEMIETVAGLLARVELPRSFLGRYPHQLSGGQRQRVAMARALALRPKIIIADEAVSALDVSVQAQVLNMMIDLQEELGISYLFISHDMAVVERMSHKVGVMYRGRLVEFGPRRAVFETPAHPYTRKLLESVLVADPRHRVNLADRASEPISSPILPLGYVPPARRLERVGPDHFAEQT